MAKTIPLTIVGGKYFPQPEYIFYQELLTDFLKKKGWEKCDARIFKQKPFYICLERSCIHLKYIIPKKGRPQPYKKYEIKYFLNNYDKCITEFNEIIFDKLL